MLVRMISHTPNPERLVYIAGRVCYHSGDIRELVEESEDIERVRRFNRKLIKQDHLSVLEHVHATFYIHGISRVCLAQLTRHRLASYSVRSHRRTKVTEFITPESFLDYPDLKCESEKILSSLYGLYECMIDIGVPKEDARFILPQGSATSLVMTANAREYRHILKLRLDRHSQWEIRHLCWRMLEQLVEVAPSLFEDIKEAYDETRRCNSGDL